MSDINKIIVCGRLTKDMELSQTQSNTALGKFSIAVNEKYKDKEEVNFFDVVVWGKVAEICSKYLSKGSQVIIDGKLKQDRFQSKDGQNRSKVSIIAQNIQFVGAKSEGNDQKQKEDEAIDFSNFGKSDPENIPF